MFSDFNNKVWSDVMKDIAFQARKAIKKKVRVTGDIPRVTATAAGACMQATIECSHELMRDKLGAWFDCFDATLEVWWRCGT